MAVNVLLLFTTGFLLSGTQSVKLEYKVGHCDSILIPRGASKTPKIKHCSSESYGGMEYLFCSLPLRTEALELPERRPRFRSHSRSQELIHEVMNVTIYLESKFSLNFETPERLSGSSRGSVGCTHTVSVSYKRTREYEHPEYHSPHLGIRKFVGQSTDGRLPTNFEIIDSYPVGSIVLVSSPISQKSEGELPYMIDVKISLKQGTHGQGDGSTSGTLEDVFLKNLKSTNDFVMAKSSSSAVRIAEVTSISHKMGDSFFYETENQAEASLSVASNLKNIEVLSISGLVTKYLASYMLQAMPQLKEFHASNCKISLLEEGVFQDNELLARIDLSRNNLNSLPFELFKDLKYLNFVDLSYNKITQGQSFEFYMHKKSSTFYGMKLLDISDNSLIKAANVIGYKSRVKHLNLANNLLQDLTGLTRERWIEELDISGNRISVLTESSLEALNSIQLVNMTNNLFNCGACELKVFQNWLNSSGHDILTSPPGDLLCMAPTHMRQQRKRVLEVEYDDKNCQEQLSTPPQDPKSNKVDSLLQMLLLAVLTFTVLFISYHFDVFDLMGTLGVIIHFLQRGRKSGYLYDACVLYSKEDQPWILREFLPAVERNENKFQFCLKVRNASTNKFFSAFMADPMEKCKKVLIVVSQYFVDSQWNETEEEMARKAFFINHPKNVILIIMEDLDEKSLPIGLKSLMETAIVLRWPPYDVVPINAEEGTTDSNEPTINHQSINLSYKLLKEFWRDLFSVLGKSLHVEDSTGGETEDENDTGLSESVKTDSESPNEEQDDDQAK